MVGLTRSLILGKIPPMSFAVIKTGGKQYKVAEGDKLEIEKLDLEKGADVVFDQVLLVGNAKAENVPTSAGSRGSSISQSEIGTKIGTPFVSGATVTAKVLEQGRGGKKIVFKFHHKTRYKKKKGHRQPFTKVEILKITA